MTSEFAVRAGAILMAISAAILARAAIGRESFWCVVAMLGAGMALLAMLPANPSVYDIAWRMMICGCGFGFFQAPNMNALMSSTPAARSGSASGMVATARMTGQTIGAAIAALCFTIAGNGGPMLALTIGIAVAALGSVVSFLRLTMGGKDGGGGRVSDVATNEPTGDKH